MEKLPTKEIIEAAILAADGPLSIQQLGEIFEERSVPNLEIKQALAEIQKSCEGRGFELRKVASGYRFQIRVEYSDWVSRLWKEKTPRYSRALLETLALIAYRQPITRGDIEDVRGVSVSSNIIRTLIERDWIKIVGYREVPGRPALYATTKAFLDYFNLERLDQLPTLQEIKELAVKNELSESSENAVSGLSSEFLVKRESDLFEAEEKDSNDLAG
jgi:segregation and condensation protein B